MKKIRNKIRKQFSGSAFFLIFLFFLCMFWGRDTENRQMKHQKELLSLNDEKKVVWEEVKEPKEVKEPDELYDRIMDEKSFPEKKDVEMIRILIKDSTYQKEFHEQVVLTSRTGIVNGKTGLAQPGESLHVDEILQPGESMEFRAADHGKITIESLSRAQGNPSYEGVLVISRSAEGFRIVNHLELETYLKYVVPSEMPSSYPMEAQKAQAVCARTYSVRQIRDRKDEEYDADDSVEFQVYNNLDENDVSNQAVAETKDQILTYEDEPITAFFYSTSCGFSATPAVWGEEEDFPYLKTEPITDENNEPYEKDETWYSWEVVFPYGDLNERAEEWFPDIGELEGFQVNKSLEGGNVIYLTVKGSNGDRTLENEYKIRDFFSTYGRQVLCQDGSVIDDMRLLPSACIQIEEIRENGQTVSYRIRGRGYGHGVGMSQNGARCMAVRGMDMEDILSRFFKHTRIDMYEMNT